MECARECNSEYSMYYLAVRHYVVCQVTRQSLSSSNVASHQRLTINTCPSLLSSFMFVLWHALRNEAALVGDPEAFVRATYIIFNPNHISCFFVASHLLLVAMEPRMCSDEVCAFPRSNCIHDSTYVLHILQFFLFRNRQ